MDFEKTERQASLQKKKVVYSFESLFRIREYANKRIVSSEQEMRLEVSKIRSFYSKKTTVFKSKAGASLTISMTGSEWTVGSRQEYVGSR